MSRRADKNKNLAISEKQIKRIETAAKQQKKNIREKSEKTQIYCTNNNNNNYRGETKLMQRTTNTLTKCRFI